MTPDPVRRQVLGAAALALVAGPMAPGLALAAAPPPELQAHWPARPAPRLQGEGVLRFLGLDIYDIRLWTPQDEPVGVDDWLGRPLALELRYRSRLVGRLIAERSLREMARAGPLDEAQARSWLLRMSEVFPDVAEGDRLTGLHDPGVRATFFHNGSLRGRIDDPAFAQRFFGIWLAAQTSEPALRERLLGA